MSAIRILSAIALALLATPAWAQEEAEAVVPPLPAPETVSATLNLALQSSGDIERLVATYQCADETSFTVQYINAPPNFLAILPVDGNNHVFVTTLSGSGARYVSGPYEWWNKGNEGTLRDLMQEADAEPMAQCTETSNTP